MVHLGLVFIKVCFKKIFFRFIAFYCFMMSVVKLFCNEDCNGRKDKEVIKNQCIIYKEYCIYKMVLTMIYLYRYITKKGAYTNIWILTKVLMTQQKKEHQI